MNARRRFRGIGFGTVKRDKFTNLLTTMTKETEEKNRKKEITDQTKVNPAYFKYDFNHEKS